MSRIAVLIGAALLVLSTESTSAQTPRGSARGPMPGEATPEGMLRTGARWVEAANRGDVDALAALYTSDAVLLLADGPAVRGRLDIRRTLAERFGTLRQLGAHRHEIEVETRELRDDLAVEHGTYSLTVQRREGGEIREYGKFLAVWKREADGEWRLHRQASSPTASPGSPRGEGMTELRVRFQQCLDGMWMLHGPEPDPAQLRRDAASCERLLFDALEAYPKRQAARPR